ncbi:hypothetical protein EX30DRAFT_171783 [Ascodesmis nigricans]|uniref:Uncharacterized protein n=1 Tax=Ascodesmis nigricans TaxID=341454 RepID=A0A4S2MM38_9PEZI|nr:hypothetical protein EX30DRAFT_171783 [Ascodesmis nigricans]
MAVSAIWESLMVPSSCRCWCFWCVLILSPTSFVVRVLVRGYRPPSSWYRPSMPVRVIRISSLNSSWLRWRETEYSSSFWIPRGVLYPLPTFQHSNPTVHDSGLTTFIHTPIHQAQLTSQAQDHTDCIIPHPPKPSLRASVTKLLTHSSRQPPTQASPSPPRRPRPHCTHHIVISSGGVAVRGCTTT